ncbi:uncharacterized protein F54H12.2-like [Clytia hemisphaerica]|uniref:uncharacterized protein F54H12.2-like n=1 Tax=Clytia hemisphaerica TaxID=252671 RepID=UPI0034D43CF0
MDDEKDYQSAHQECALSDTDVFTPAFVQTDIKQGVYEDVYPISKLNDNGPVEFVVENASETFLDLANTYFKFSLKIVKADGADLEEDEKVAPVNYIFGALASQVDVSLGGVSVSTSHNNYAYRTYEEALLNYARDAKKSQLTMGLYAKDQHGKCAAHDPDQNTTLKQRQEFFAESKVVDLIGKIHSDIFNQGKLILNGLTLKVTSLRNKPEFMLLIKSLLRRLLCV